MNKDKRYCNQFDSFLFMMSIALNDLCFALNENPERCINSNYSNPKHIEKLVSKKLPKENNKETT